MAASSAIDSASMSIPADSRTGAALRAPADRPGLVARALALGEVLFFEDADPVRDLDFFICLRPSDASYSKSLATRPILVEQEIPRAPAPRPGPE
jgi:hypothetical protein